MFKHLLSLFVVASFLLSASGAEPEKSVIQILVFSQQPAWDQPWRFTGVGRGSGSGFVVRGRKIITNAHVVSWARQILLRKYQDPRPYQARVQFIAHDCDLALLEVEDEKFFDGLEPLEIGDLPEVRSTVVTYGYPAGGEQISYTRGVVSRVEVQSYVHIGNRSFLAVQTDAAINPGNSGGPVIQDDKVVGVAFQGTPGLENTGFFIPPPVLRQFLKDIEDGIYHGRPQAGLRIVPLQNPAYRSFLKLPDDNQGARVDFIYPIPSTRKLVQPDDVLLQVGPYAVGSDANIIYKGNRVHVGVAFSEAQHGETVPIKLWRQGKAMDLALPVQVLTEDDREGNQYDTLPRYYVYAGLVFVPLSREYLKTFGANWTDAASAELIYELFYRRQESPETVRPEAVVLAGVLTHAVNADMRIRARVMVNKINGRKIEKMEDVIAAFQSETGDHHVLEFLPDQNIECLDRQAAAKANAEILESNRIPKDRRL